MSWRFWRFGHKFSVELRPQSVTKVPTVASSIEGALQTMLLLKSSAAYKDYRTILHASKHLKNHRGARPVTSKVELRPQPVTTSPLLSIVSSNSAGSRGSFVTWKRVVPAAAWNHLHDSIRTKGVISVCYSRQSMGADGVTRPQWTGDV